MGFKLVRVDATEPCKIPLAVGTHFIGRGKFLDCHDHRVSRNHGQLEVTDDTVHITALHKNPCFFRNKTSLNTNILPQNESIELSNGDQFGLVPDSYWYELIYYIESLVPPCLDHHPTPVKIEKSANDEPSVSGSSCKVSQVNDEPSVSGSSCNVSQVDIENTVRIQPSTVSQDTESTFMDTALQTDVPSTSPYKRPHSEDSPNKVIKKVRIEPQRPCVGPCENQAGTLHVEDENQLVNNENQEVRNENQGINNENQDSSNNNIESPAINSEINAATSENQAVNSESQAVNRNETLQGNVMLCDANASNASESETETGTTLATVKTELFNPDIVKTESCSQDIVKTNSCSQDTVKTESCSQDTVKTEPFSQDAVNTDANNETLNEEPTNSNVKIEPNSQENVDPGPSNNQLGVASAASASDKASAGAAAPAQPVSPAGAAVPAPPAGAAVPASPAGAPVPAQPAPCAAGARPREKCMYGAQCYRVNPSHKAQFSHPGDADWAVRVPCRWGAACRDIRPAHWRDHDHPPRQEPQERRRGGHGVRMKRIKLWHRRRSDSDDSDDSSKMIKTRTRNAGLPNKKIITDESDSEEKDPFASDDTDDWVPSDDN